MAGRMATPKFDDRQVAGTLRPCWATAAEIPAQSPVELPQTSEAVGLSLVDITTDFVEDTTELGQLRRSSTLTWKYPPYPDQDRANSGPSRPKRAFAGRTSNHCQAQRKLSAANSAAGVSKLMMGLPTAPPCPKSVRSFKP